jgi:MFS family permease
MVPLELFKSRAFTGANVLTLFLYAAIGAFFFLYPMNLIQVHGYSATQAGAASLPSIVLMFSLSRWAGGLVVRVGPRIPLVAGPLIVATGFVLFAMPSMQGHYWTSYFPAFVVLGFGLTVTVAPLTTVVMTSVDQERSGAASGINNAVARVAGVLSIAVLGIIMVHAFGSKLEQSLASLRLPDPVVHQIRSQKSRLAALEAPAELDEAAKDAVRAAVQNSFGFGFRVMLMICVALSVMSSGIAWVMVGKEITPLKTTTPP